MYIVCASIWPYLSTRVCRGHECTKAQRGIQVPIQVSTLPHGVRGLRHQRGAQSGALGAWPSGVPWLQINLDIDLYRSCTPLHACIHARMGPQTSTYMGQKRRVLDPYRPVQSHTGPYTAMSTHGAEAHLVAGRAYLLHLVHQVQEHHFAQGQVQCSGQGLHL